MKIKIIFAFACIFLFILNLSAVDFTVSSYNCGGLSDHYDYIRAASMQKLMQTRYNVEPEIMARIEKIQHVALKTLFSKNPAEQSENCDQNFFVEMTGASQNSMNPNSSWFELSEKTVTSYQIRPIKIYDVEVNQMLFDHLRDTTKGNGIDVEGRDYTQLLDDGRRIMAERIFRHHLKYDIICLQEADYLDESMFPEQYKVALSKSGFSVNGIAWNIDRFELLDLIGDISSRAFAVELLDKNTEKTVLVVSGHLTGCNPFKAIENPETKLPDSFKGDNELRTICQWLDYTLCDIKIIAMDSNVAATHPRLKILKDFSYQLDYENFLESTCTNPNFLLNTRIDWIGVKSGSQLSPSVTNIPVLGVGLNSIQTNISDHKPVAARIQY